MIPNDGRDGAPREGRIKIRITLQVVFRETLQVRPRNDQDDAPGENT